MSVLDGHKLRATRMTMEFVGRFTARSWKALSGPSFAFPAFVSDADLMMKNLSNAATIGNEAASRLAGARILVMEKCFDALVETMVADGSVPVNAAAVMLEYLAERVAGRGS